MNIICYIITLISVLFVTDVYAVALKPMEKASVRADHDALLKAQIQKAYDQVKGLSKRIASVKQGVDLSSQLALQNALDALKIKQTLVENFVGTPSLQHAPVRERLLAILQQETISSPDLLELQMLVAKHKQ